MSQTTARVLAVVAAGIFAAYAWQFGNEQYAKHVKATRRAVLAAKRAARTTRQSSGSREDAGVTWAMLMARGDAAASAEDLETAEASYRGALKLSPDLAPARINLCNVLVHRGAYGLAVSECELAVAVCTNAEEESVAQLNLGVAHRRARGALGVPAALAAFAKAAELDAASLPARIYLSSAATSAGDVALATGASIDALGVTQSPAVAGTYLSLALALASDDPAQPVVKPLLDAAFLETSFAQALDAAVDQARAADPAQPEQLAALLFARFRVQDLAGETDAAWETLLEANALKKDGLAQADESNWGPTASIRARDAVMEAFGNVGAFVERNTVATEASSEPRPAAPLLLVGAPRSGATLLHAMLSRVPRVRCDGDEHSILGDLVSRVGMSGFARALADDAPEGVAEGLAGFGQAYADTLRNATEATEDDLYVLDGNVENVWWAGAAAAGLLPSASGARFVVVRRNREATALSLFATLFATQGREWTFDGGDVAARVDAMNGLAEFWLSALGPSVVRVVEYEDLVAHPEETLKALLEWLGVEWSDAALAPREATLAFISPAAVEVRGPLKSAADAARASARYGARFNEMLAYTVEEELDEDQTE